MGSRESVNLGDNWTTVSSRLLSICFRTLIQTKRKFGFSLSGFKDETTSSGTQVLSSSWLCFLGMAGTRWRQLFQAVTSRPEGKEGPSFLHSKE